MDIDGHQFFVDLFEAAQDYHIWVGYFIFKQPEVFDGEFYSNLFLPIKNKNETHL